MRALLCCLTFFFSFLFNLKKKKIATNNSLLFYFIYYYLLFLCRFLTHAMRLTEKNNLAVGMRGASTKIVETSLDIFFFFLLSAEACINSYAGALRGRSPDSMSGTGMSSIQIHHPRIRSHLKKKKFIRGLVRSLIVLDQWLTSH